MDDMGQPDAAWSHQEESDGAYRSPVRSRPAHQDRVRTLPVRSIDEVTSSARRSAILTRTVELDVIPLLMAARASTQLAQLGVEPVHVVQLTELSLGDDISAVAAFVLGMFRQGVPAETLYLDLLAPSARRLGEFWDDDICDFTSVSIGLMRLHGAMRELGPHFLANAGPARGPRALLVPLPGEQHTFGLSMVHDFFCRAGWNAWSGPVDTRAELAGMVAREHVDLVGFSLACDERLEAARDEIAAVRSASRNPRLAVMVGGPPFMSNPSLARSIGADGTALDGLQAVGAASALVGR